MRVGVELRELLTDLRVKRSYVPGGDFGTYKEIRVEEDRFQFWQTRGIEAEAAKTIREDRLASWPLPFSSRVWIDLDRRYDSLPVELWSIDPLLRTPAPIPGGQLVLDHGHGQEHTDPADAPVTTLLPWRDVQAKKPDPAGWFRLDTENEQQRKLSEKLYLQWRAARSGGLRLVVPDNDFITPFDLTKPERYSISNEDGDTLPESALDIAPGTDTVVYLKARRWRWFVKTIAHYTFITPFETVANDELFLTVYHDRPPFWPHRHDVAHTREIAEVPWFDGTPMSYDPGIDAAWDSSRAAGEMRHQIAAQQWFSLCVSYVLIGVEDAMITLQREAVAQAEPVAVIEKRDRVSDTKERIIVTTKTDQAEWYPRTLIGIFYGRFYV